MMFDVEAFDLHCTAIHEAAHVVVARRLGVFAVARISAEAYDAILTDYHLPDGTSEELVRAWCAAGTSPCIMMTGSDAGADVAVRLGVTLIRKPTRPREVATRMRDLLGSADAI